MRLLDRYVLRELALPLGASLGGFTIFWIAFDMLVALEKFQKAGMGVGAIAAYYLVGLPELLNTTLPVALLLALLYAITAHARHHELTAMRAAGIALWRICLPYLGLGLAASGLLYWLNEHGLPDSRERQARLVEHAEGPGNEPDSWLGPVNFDNQSAGRSWSIGSFNPVSGEIRSVRLLLPVAPGARREVRIAAALWTNGAWRLSGVRETLWRSADDPAPAVRETAFTPLPPLPGTNAVSTWTGGSLALSNAVLRTGIAHADPASGAEWAAAVYDPRGPELTGLVLREPVRPGAQRQFLADAGVWQEGAWKFTNGNEYVFRNSRDREPLWLPGVGRMAELTESPDVIRSELRVAGFNRMKAFKRPELTVREVTDYRRLHPRVKPEMAAWLETQLQARLAAPWTCLVVVFIAVPFAAPSGRRNIFFGVAGSIALAFAYFVIQRIGFALGQNGAVPSWLGAWLPNIVFATTGIALTARVR